MGLKIVIPRFLICVITRVRLTTVDNIDTVYGQVSLVMAMYGYPGHYGIKQTADAFIPPLE